MANHREKAGCCAPGAPSAPTLLPISWRAPLTRVSVTFSNLLLLESLTGGGVGLTDQEGPSAGKAGILYAWGEGGGEVSGEG